MDNLVKIMPNSDGRCDRILWYGKGVKQLSYFRSESKFSDHRPVSALFSTQVEVVKSINLKGVAIHPILPNIVPPKQTVSSSSLNTYMFSWALYHKSQLLLRYENLWNESSNYNNNCYSIIKTTMLIIFILIIRIVIIFQGQTETDEGAKSTLLSLIVKDMESSPTHKKSL